LTCERRGHDRGDAESQQESDKLRAHQHSPFFALQRDEFSTGLRMRKGPRLGRGAQPKNVVMLT
jgi:hypothetical protein